MFRKGAYIQGLGGVADLPDVIIYPDRMDFFRVSVKTGQHADCTSETRFLAVKEKDGVLSEPGFISLQVLGRDWYLRLDDDAEVLNDHLRYVREHEGHRWALLESITDLNVKEAAYGLKSYEKPYCVGGLYLQ